MKKKCHRCKRLKRVGTDGDFYRNRTKSDGYDGYCKECRNAVGKPYRRSHAETDKARDTNHTYYLKNRDKILKYNRDRALERKLAKYGVDVGAYEAILERQRGVCAICGRGGSRRLAIDHDHETGELRGLLCTNCNLGVGNFMDDVSLLQRAIEYLQLHQE